MGTWDRSKWFSKCSIYNLQKWKWNGANAFPWFSVSMTNNAKARTSKPCLLNIYILKPPNKDTFIFPQIHSRPSADEKSCLRNSNKSFQKKNYTGVFEHIIMFYCNFKEQKLGCVKWQYLFWAIQLLITVWSSLKKADFLLGITVHNLNLQKAEQSQNFALRLTITTLADQSVLSLVFWCIVDVFVLKKETKRKGR